MDYKTLVIDVDGTLYSGNVYLNVSRRAADKLLDFTASLGHSDAVTPALLANINKGRISYSIDYLAKKFKIDRERFFRHVYDMIPEEFGIEKDGQLIQDLTRLDGKYKICLFTNSPVIWTNRVLNALGIANFFDPKRRVTVETLGYGEFIKPTPEAFKIMIDVIGGSPGEMLYLDDSEGNVKEGTANGIHSILICNDKHDCREHHCNAYSIYEVLEGLKTD